MVDPVKGLATDDTRIQVNWQALTGDQTGGSAILSYDLEMLVNNVPITIIGQTTYYNSTSYLVQSGIVAGQSYKFRVRAINKWGYGPYSNWVAILASADPDRLTQAPTTQN